MMRRTLFTFAMGIVVLAALWFAAPMLLEEIARQAP